MNRQLLVLSAGPAVSIQDMGRPGYCRFGLSKGGAMDLFAMAEGSALLGNSTSEAAIEMAGFGGKFRAEGGPIFVALTGAPMRSAVDNVPLPWRTGICLQEGQILEISSVLDNSGVYGYLHLQGGIQVTPEIGSMGTHLRAGIGGVDGKALSAGARLDIGASGEEHPGINKLPMPEYFGRSHLRILWGAQSDRFNSETRERMLTDTFCISHRRDRMAMQLTPVDNDEPFESLLSGLSDPVQDGEIQMTGDGVPAIVVREHQPTGGYPRIASVISADLTAAAQLPTGVPFKFELVDDALAIEALQKWRNQIAQIPSKVQPVIRSPNEIQNLLDYNLIDGVVSASDEG